MIPIPETLQYGILGLMAVVIFLGWRYVDTRAKEQAEREKDRDKVISDQTQRENNLLVRLVEEADKRDEKRLQAWQDMAAKQNEVQIAVVRTLDQLCASVEEGNVASDEQHNEVKKMIVGVEEIVERNMLQFIEDRRRSHGRTIDP